MHLTVEKAATASRYGACAATRQPALPPAAMFALCRLALPQDASTKS